MKPHISPHHKVVIVLHASIIYESEVSITVLCLLCSPHYTAVWIKNCSKSKSESSHYKNIMVLHAPVIIWNRSIHCPSPSAMFDSSTNQELFEKHLCNKSSCYENTDNFLLCKGSHHMQRPNLCFSLSAKMNGTQRRTLVSPWRMHCTYYDMPKDTSHAEVTSNSEKNQACSLSRYRATLVWMHQASI